jgi:aminomethyltransferase
MELKKTPLYQKHIENKGKIVDFAGWALPVEYRSTLAEAKAVRSTCGLFDVTHMGEILIKGNDSFEFLQKLTPNDISLIKPGQMQYNLFLNDEAGIIDDLMVYRKQNGFLCVVNSSNKDKVFRWLDENAQGQIEVIDESQRTALISLQGPASQKVISRVFGESIANLSHMHFLEEEIEGKVVFASRSGYTGEDGFEIYLPWQDACYWWDRFIEAGSQFGLMLCGLGARDILRIEEGYPLYGHEIDEAINPYEATLGWVVKLNKDFVGREHLIKAKEEGLVRRRTGFVMEERAMARQGYLVYCGQGAIGKVCSATYSPNIDKFIGMAYVETQFAKEGTLVEIEVRNKLYKAKIARFPFVS